MMGRWYNAVWRWHFYAGLFCLPFVIWLSLTGSLYLWRPQIEAWLDWPYDSLATAGPTASPDAQVQAALAAVPGSRLSKYQLADSPSQAVRILVNNGNDVSRVYVDPRSLAVLHVVGEEQRLFRVIFHLHGELLAGAVGSYVVETAACWTIVMLITGIFLWWPRDRRGFGGVLYPRLFRGGRSFWRDIHATAGFWVSLFALCLILTGLPWAKGWGSYLNEIRLLTGQSRGPVDWSIGGKAPKDAGMASEHAGHVMPAMNPPIASGELERVIATVQPLGITAPVLISPPKNSGGPWSVTSDAANRPLRADLKVDGKTGRLIDRKNFSDRHWIDRTIGYGVALHEGALFGLANQIIGTVTAAFLVLLSVSGTLMWWRRRPAGTLGAPLIIGQQKFPPVLVLSIVMLALYMPMFGLTLIGVLLLDTTILSRSERLSGWFGRRALSAQ